MVKHEMTENSTSFPLWKAMPDASSVNLVTWERKQTGRRAGGGTSSLWGGLSSPSCSEQQVWEGWRAGKCNSSFAGKESKASLQLPTALPSPATGPSRLGIFKGPCPTCPYPQGGAWFQGWGCPWCSQCPAPDWGTPGLACTAPGPHSTLTTG